MQVRQSGVTPNIPLRVRIYEDLAASIRQKRLLPGGKLPTMSEVAKQYGVSVRTAEIAFGRLKTEGLVFSRTGSGTFVAHPVEAAVAAEVILCVHPKLMQSTSNDPLLWIAFTKFSGIISGAERRHVRLVPIVNRTAFDSCIHPQIRQGLILFDLMYEADGFGEVARYAVEHKWPVCVVTGQTPNLLCVEDHRGIGFEQATTHLLSMGHRRIAYLNLTPDIRYPANTKRLVEGPRDGYLRAHKRAGVKPVAGLYMEVPPPEGAGPGPTVEAVERLLSRDPRPTAIVASNDARAWVVLDVLKAHGIGVPQEMSVVGCDDRPESERLSPPLTSINTALSAQGEEAVNYIVNVLQGRRAPLPSVMPRLVVRASSGVPPARPANGDGFNRQNCFSSAATAHVRSKGGVCRFRKLRR